VGDEHDPVAGRDTEERHEAHQRGDGEDAALEPDADDSADVKAGMVVVVTEGTASADTMWALTTNDPITLGTTGLATCYDLRFPELFRGLVDAGATAVVMGSGWPATRWM
jgi:hypothetical protein